MKRKELMNDKPLTAAQLDQLDEDLADMNACGKEIREYCEKYKGTPTYTEVMLAIEFGAQLAQKYKF